ncbi:MAG TPA: FISUMP domain-containing protein [Niabella sp.]|mgnify:CR=1 FL=1|nr:FISUMP domain-containing protein [Niabella sp.]
MRKGNLLVFLSIITTLIFLLTTGCRRDRVAKTSPVLSSTSISDITAVSAVAGGNISNDGGSPVTARGLVWSTSANPTLQSNNGKTSDGSGAGSFSSSITGLNANTTYYARAYATNSIGTAYGNELSFKTLSTLAVLTTNQAEDITATTAACGGNVGNDGGGAITARGVVWGTAQNPTIETNAGKTSDGTGTGSFSSVLNNLNPNTTYYARAYASNSVGTAYGNEITFKTSTALAVLTTFSAGEITSTSALSGGNITTDGGASVTDRGIVWHVIPNPTLENCMGTSKAGSGTGNFNAPLIMLSPNITYYVKAYATNSVGTAYGNEISFKTQSATASLTTNAITGITGNSATSGGDITSDGGVNVTARGVVWSTSQSPTLENNTGKTNDGTGKGNYSSNLTGLLANTTYYVRAFATNSEGTAYGNELSFRTQSSIATLTTNSVGSITATTAVSGGNISSDGGASVTSRGIVWSTTSGPTIQNNQGKTTNGSGTGNFSSNLVGLTAGTTFYVRAYATNSNGTAYGNELSFKTTGTLASVTTDAVTNITSTTAVSGGDISSDGGSAITAKGIVWSTASNPTLQSNTGSTNDGTGSSGFTSHLTGLSANTTYHVRAYVTNSTGTAYGNEVTFITAGLLPILNTNAVTNITSSSAVSGGTITSDGGAAITAKGLVWSTSSNPTLQSNSGSSNNGTGIAGFSANLTGLISNTTYYIRAYATNNAGTSYGNELSFKTSAGNTFTDTRDGNVYRTITIAGKTWLAENLRYLPNVVGPASGSTSVAYYYVFGYNGTDINAAKANANYPIYGALYNWAAAQVACPPGWHLPTYEEWYDLLSALGGENSAGGKLKETGNLHWNNPNAGATNESWFTAFAGGYRNDAGSFINKGAIGSWWGSSTDVKGNAAALSLSYSSSVANIYYANKAFGFSIRCVKN